MEDELASPPGSDGARETDIWSEAGSVAGAPPRKKKKKGKRKRNDESNDESWLDIIKQQSATIKNLQMQILELTKILKNVELDAKNTQNTGEMTTNKLTTYNDGNFPDLSRQDQVSLTQTSLTHVQDKETPQMEVSDADQNTNSRYAWLLKRPNKINDFKGKIIKPISNNVGKPAPSPTKNTTTTTSNDKKVSTTTTSKAPKPAPIYLREKCNTALITLVTGIIGQGNFYTATINRPAPETKIQVAEEIHFRKLTAEFERMDKNFFTFQLKTEKGMTVVIRGIEPEVPVDEIKDAIEKEGFIVKNVHNIINRLKVPQPLHLITLDPGAKKLKKSEIHPIYKIRYLLHRKITIEEPRRRTGPVQCFNCQEYGHTKSYCQLPTVCVICGDNHSSADCNKDKQDPNAKLCKNCGGNHTANFRGCAVYTHIKNKKTNDHEKPKPAEKTAKLTTSRVQPGTTYAQAASNKQNIDEAATNAHPPAEAIMTMLSTFMSSMQNMMTQMTNILTK